MHAFIKPSQSCDNMLVPWVHQVAKRHLFAERRLCDAHLACARGAPPRELQHKTHVGTVRPGGTEARDHLWGVRWCWGLCSCSNCGSNFDGDCCDPCNGDTGSNKAPECRWRSIHDEGWDSKSTSVSSPLAWIGASAPHGLRGSPPAAAVVTWAAVARVRVGLRL